MIRASSSVRRLTTRGVVEAWVGRIERGPWLYSSCRWRHPAPRRYRGTLMEVANRHAVSKDAQYTIILLNGAKNDPAKLDSIVKDMFPRLLREDLLSLLHALVDERQMGVATKVLDHIREQSWYRPETSFYRHFLQAYAEACDFEQVAKMFEEAVLRGAGLHKHQLVEIMESMVEGDRLPLAYQIFERLKSVALKKKPRYYFALIHALNKQGRFEESLKVEEELYDLMNKEYEDRFRNNEIHQLEPWAS